jgi:hypothetical protein
VTESENIGRTEVLTVLRGYDAEPPVSETAEVVARLVGAGIRKISLAGAHSPQRAAEQVLAALHQPRVVTGVLASDSGARPLWHRVVERAGKPVVLVPAAAEGRQPGIHRVLLPLDGTARSAAAVAAMAEQSSRAGVDLVVLHVFDAETVPKFWDQHAHAGQTWAQEFLARYLAQPSARMELRMGTAVEHVLQVAEAEQADMITLVWSQCLEPGRALIVRRTILDAAVPVMLVPINPEKRGVQPY